MSKTSRTHPPAEVLLHLAHQALSSDLLSDQERLVVWLRVWRGLPWSEVGAAVNLSPAAARMRFASVRERLNVLLPGGSDEDTEGPVQSD
jgi:DNA-directed RNA polymerase specialized sigma24 family protein